MRFKNRKPAVLREKTFWLQICFQISKYFLHLHTVICLLFMHTICFSNKYCHIPFYVVPSVLRYVNLQPSLEGGSSPKRTWPIL